MIGRWTQAAAAAAGLLLLAAGPAMADGMPPEFADPGVRAAPAPAPQAAPTPVVRAVPAPLPLDIAPPPPPEPVVFTVTFAESVGYFARIGYEATRDNASLYCARYGRVATLDARFRVESDWYVRFKCLPPA